MILSMVPQNGLKSNAFLFCFDWVRDTVSTHPRWIISHTQLTSHKLINEFIFFINLSISRSYWIQLVQFKLGWSAYSNKYITI